MNKRLSGHTAYKTEYHVVWVTKYRKPVLDTEIQKYLSRLFPLVIAMMPGCEIVEYKMLVNHVHLVIVIPPKYAVKDVVGRLKSITSSRLRSRFRELEKLYWKDNVIWSPGYFVASVGLPEDKILSYVRSQ
jgi:putative transposase